MITTESDGGILKDSRYGGQFISSPTSRKENNVKFKTVSNQDVVTLLGPTNHAY